LVAQQMMWWEANNGQQPGDPVKVAQALIRIASETRPPRSCIAGADAVRLTTQNVADLQAQIEAYPDWSTAMAQGGVE
jgi:hypothetical protein